MSDIPVILGLIAIGVFYVFMIAYVVIQLWRHRR